ncbi:MAG: universal stress protein [Polyangiaceae bacterium]
MTSARRSVDAQRALCRHCRDGLFRISQPRALLRAFDVALYRENAEIHVVSVVNSSTVSSNPNPSRPRSPMDDMAPLERAFERLRAHVEARLESFLATIGVRERTFSGRVFSHVTEDSSGLGIAQLASDLNANLIVVGTHGRRGLARLVMGSFAETTMRHARCPVLVIPPRERPELSESV